MAMPLPVIRENPVTSGSYSDRLRQLAELYEQSVKTDGKPSDRLIRAWREFVGSGGRGRDERRLHLQMSSGVTLIFTGQEAAEVMAALLDDKVIN